MTTFCKSIFCPSPQKLVAHLRSKLNGEESQKVCDHLGECEFCEAELAFYKNYPQAEEPCQAVEIPLPLFQLAESILTNRSNEFLEGLFADSKIQI